MKRCSICKAEKPLGDFDTLPRGTYGRQSGCKECRKAYTRTEYQVIRTQWAKMPEPKVSLDEILWWAQHETLFNSYFKQWEEGGYLRKQKPKIRRKDTTQPYLASNLKVLP